MDALLAAIADIGQHGDEALGLHPLQGVGDRALGDHGGAGEFGRSLPVAVAHEARQQVELSVAHAGRQAAADDLTHDLADDRDFPEDLDVSAILRGWRHICLPYRLTSNHYHFALQCQVFG
ncbi:MAG: hypothetical protein Q8M88_03640 [Phenylobacterium sp.]|nr:hypothetical protein [Phenylobacterium sp.]MDP3173509.1 hypothetical protein [Phenylobacterium sp.]